MRASSFLHCALLLLPAGLPSLALPPTVGTTILSQASQAFSAGKAVTSVELTGTAHWIAGSMKDSGPARLTAKITGENTAEFDLSNGTRIEKQSALTEERTCTWSGKDGVEHNVASANCWTATVWFLPHLALQSSGLPPTLRTQALVADKDHPTASRLTHQVTIAPEGQSEITELIRTWSKTDLTVDPSTYLPIVLKYAIYPDHHPGVTLQIEIRYSNYKSVSGVELPMHIERYVNGVLQVSMDIESAIVN